VVQNKPSMQTSDELEWKRHKKRKMKDSNLRCCQNARPSRSKRTAGDKAEKPGRWVFTFVAMYTVPLFERPPSAHDAP
jgi:hypothetical protein